MNLSEIMLCVLAIGCLAALVICTVKQHNAMCRIQAQADEHVKLFMTHAEKAVNRVFATGHPQAHWRTRQSSGTVEGAQAAVKGHYEEADDEFPGAVPATIPPPIYQDRPRNGVAMRRDLATTLDADDIEGDAR